MLACKHHRIGRKTIETVEIDFDVVRMSESRISQKRQVVETHWVEPENCFISRSEQWLGPDIGSVEVDIIRPYAG